jgi:2-dehydro-3-deoxygluconokinase
MDPLVVSFGECMLELSHTVLGGKNWALGHGGDTYNFAVYLARIGLKPSFMTAIGRDPFSELLLANWDTDGVDTSMVVRHPDRHPGLYAIRNDDSGERTFVYWRSEAAARAFFECADADRVVQQASKADLLFVSAITLSLFDERGRARIAEIAAAVRNRGGIVAFDTNYREKGWSSALEAKRAIENFARHATILLPTLDDEQKLHTDIDHVMTAKRWLNFGVEEVVVKIGEKGAYVASRDNDHMHVPVDRVLTPKDTTGAGDAFNAAYIGARLRGASPAVAAASGNRLASSVVIHHGAVIPKVVMPTRILP